MLNVCIALYLRKTGFLIANYHVYDFSWKRVNTTNNPYLIIVLTIIIFIQRPVKDDSVKA